MNNKLKGTSKNLLRNQSAAKGSARNLAYLTDMSRLLRAGRLAFWLLITIFRGALKPFIGWACILFVFYPASVLAIYDTCPSSDYLRIMHNDWKFAENDYLDLQNRVNAAFKDSSVACYKKHFHELIAKHKAMKGDLDFSTDYLIKMLDMALDKKVKVLALDTKTKAMFPAYSLEDKYAVFIPGKYRDPFGSFSPEVHKPDNPLATGSNPGGGKNLTEVPLTAGEKRLYEENDFILLVAPCGFFGRDSRENFPVVVHELGHIHFTQMMGYHL